MKNLLWVFDTCRRSNILASEESSEQRDTQHNLHIVSNIYDYDLTLHEKDFKKKVKIHFLLFYLFIIFITS